MGSKYTSQAASGYNASPPSDDGTVSESNKVKWSTIKTKLSDVVKTLAEGINTALVTALDKSARSVTAADSAAASDNERTIEVKSSSVSITLADAATMAAGYIVSVANQTSGNITVPLATSTNTIDMITNAVDTISAYECRRYIVNAASNGYIRASNSSVQIKVVSFQRDVSTASGTQAVTGIGFKPKGAIFVMGISGNAARASIGVDDGTTAGVIYANAGSTVGQFNVTNEAIYANTTDGATAYQGHVTSWDADGFTVTWTKTGSPTGTITVKALCFR